MTAWLRAERETVGGDRPPVAVLVVGAVTVALIALPLIAVVATVDLARVPALLAAPSSLAALGLSLGTTLVSTALCTLLGVPLALLLARVAFPGRGIVRLLVLVPLVLPPVVGGIALTSAFGRRGLLGPVLEVAGIEIGFTTAAVILSQCFVAMPFLVLALEGALHSTGEDERTAADLGAGPWTRLVRVTLPGVAPALRLGILLAFARAIGEFGATLTFAGSLEGVTRTLPLEIYLQREVDPDAALALSLALMLLAGVVVLVGYAAPAARETRARRRAFAAGAASDGAFREDAIAPATLGATGDAPVAADARPLAARVRSEQRGLDVDLEVEAGTRVAIVGANGAGKSSLLAAIAGRYAPTAARIAVGDRILTSTGGGTGAGTVRRRLVPQHRRGVVLLGQATRLLPRLSVLDNVAFGPRASGTDRAHALERARTMLQAAGIAHLADRRPHTLSGGQAQRAMLARALAIEPDVILLDEPFVAVDAASLPGLRETVERLTRGRTTLVVSHDAGDVAALADRVLTLEGGRIVEDRPVREPAADASTGTAAR